MFALVATVVVPVCIIAPSYEKLLALDLSGEMLLQWFSASAWCLMFIVLLIACCRGADTPPVEVKFFFVITLVLFVLELVASLPPTFGDSTVLNNKFYLLVGVLAINIIFCITVGRDSLLNSILLTIFIGLLPLILVRPTSYSVVWYFLYAATTRTHLHYRRVLSSTIYVRHHVDCCCNFSSLMCYYSII